jgi:hypothetical protein
VLLLLAGQRCCCSLQSLVDDLLHRLLQLLLLPLGCCGSLLR